jgi:hypothetical protein
MRRPTPCAGTATRSLPVTVVHRRPGAPSVVLVGPGTGFGQRSPAPAQSASPTSGTSRLRCVPSRMRPAPSTDVSAALHYRQPADVKLRARRAAARRAPRARTNRGLMDPSRIGFKGYRVARSRDCSFNTLRGSGHRLGGATGCRRRPEPDSQITGTYLWSSGTSLHAERGRPDHPVPSALEASRSGTSSSCRSSAAATSARHCSPAVPGVPRATSPATPRPVRRCWSPRPPTRRSRLGARRRRADHAAVVRALHRVKPVAADPVPTIIQSEALTSRSQTGRRNLP